MSSNLPWRPLSLTLVTETFPPEVNGVARTLGRWVKEFQSRGHIVQVIRPRQPSEKPSPELVHGLPVPMYPQLRFGVASPMRLASVMQKALPDVVHIATEGPLGWAALYAAATVSVPVASSFHTNFDHYASHYGMGPLEGILNALLRWFHNATEVTLVPSEATRRRLLAEGVERVEIWTRGVDHHLFNPARRDPDLRDSLGLGSDGVLIAYVGRLASEKNLQALLTAFQELQQANVSGKPLKLVLVGAGPLGELLRYNAPRDVILAGEQRGTALASWYASADIFAFPSCSETFGNVVLEAQASGLPVVGFDTQGVNERIADGVDGFLVAPGASMTASLAKLIENASLRERFGHAARLKAAEQDWEPIFDRLEQTYLRLKYAHDAKVGVAAAPIRAKGRPARALAPIRNAV